MPCLSTMVNVGLDSIKDLPNTAIHRMVEFVAIGTESFALLSSRVMPCLSTMVNASLDNIKDLPNTAIP